MKGYAHYLNKKHSQVEVKLKTVVFQEGESFVVYCPALDLSGYGDSKEDARTSFETSLEIYLEYAIEHGTLVEDLLNHGWTLSRIPDTVYSPPAISETKEKIRKMVGLSTYQEIEESIALPA